MIVVDQNKIDASKIKGKSTVAIEERLGDRDEEEPLSFDGDEGLSSPVEVENEAWREGLRCQI